MRADFVDGTLEAVRDDTAIGADLRHMVALRGVEHSAGTVSYTHLTLPTTPYV